MIDSRYIRALNIIYERLKDTDINWAVTGSLGFALQGMRVEVHDIDIQTDKNGAYQIENIFEEYVIKRVFPKTSEKIRSHFGELNIDGIKIEIMGDIQKQLEDNKWEEPVDLIRYKRIIELQEMEIPVLSLEYEYQAYLQLGRKDKAKKIEDFLDKKSEE